MQDNRLSDEAWFERNGWAGAAGGPLVAPLNGEQLDEFKEIVTPLEQRAARPLGGPGRSLCLRAFGQEPHGFRECAADAYLRGSNPLGLLITMVRAGEHRERVATPEGGSIEGIAEIAREGLSLADGAEAA